MDTEYINKEFSSKKKYETDYISKMVAFSLVGELEFTFFGLFFFFWKGNKNSSS